MENEAKLNWHWQRDPGQWTVIGLSAYRSSIVHAFEFGMRWIIAVLCASATQSSTMNVTHKVKVVLREVSPLPYIRNVNEGLQQSLIKGSLSTSYIYNVNSDRQFRSSNSRHIHSLAPHGGVFFLSLIHIWRCRRSTLCRSRWSPYH